MTAVLFGIVLVAVGVKMNATSDTSSEARKGIVVVVMGLVVILLAAVFSAPVH